MSTDNFIVEVQDRVCTITINRPDRRNSFTHDMWKEFGATMRGLNDRDDIRVAVVRGAGEKAFSSGIDLAEMAASGASVTDPEAWENIGVEGGMHSITEFRYPVIAMVNGYAIAGGCELALHCDIIIAGDNARFAMPLAKIGLMVPFALAQRLIHAAGATYARDMLYTGRFVSADEALQIGMVNEVVPAAELEARVQVIAKEIAGNAPLSLEGMKKTLSRCFAHEREIESDDLREWMAKCLGSEDVKEGIAAFMERRKPEFKGE